MEEKKLDVVPYSGISKEPTRYPVALNKKENGYYQIIALISGKWSSICPTLFASVPPADKEINRIIALNHGMFYRMTEEQKEVLV